MKNILHSFKNIKTNSSIVIEQVYNRNYMLTQYNPSGSKQHLKLDENGLTKFLNNINSSPSWEELPVKC